MRKQGDLAVASVYGGSGCVELKGPEVVDELQELLRLLTLCMLFSKKTFPEFLDSARFSLDHVLLHNPKAELLMPAFTIIHDTPSKCFLLLIRGTHSIKDTLTAATGAVVPFHHSILNDGGISNLVLGYAHCGMVAAARWIAKLCTPTLLKALTECPDSKIKVAASSWLNDLWDQVEHTKVLKVVYRSATALRSHLQSISSAKDKVAGAGAILWPVTSGTQVVMKRAQSVAKAVVKTMDAQHRNIVPLPKSKLDNLAEASLVPESLSVDTTRLLYAIIDESPFTP
ncbi:sn1-specific diacylglycerol lipase beta [Spatholobus suberectus]|nr:sn1-specific diacylglycerol lipase beta [Spatholobus suberectus]